MIDYSTILLNPITFNSFSGWSDALKQQCQLNIQGLTFFLLFITVLQAAVTYQKQQRPWQSDIVANDGHDLPCMKVLRKTNLITISPRCLSMFLVQELLLFELQQEKKRRGAGLSIYIYIIRFTCLSTGLLSCHSIHKALPLSLCTPLLNFLQEVCCVGIIMLSQLGRYHSQ